MKLLQALADEVRALAGLAICREYQAICGWLDAFDGMAELAEDAQDWRTRIGVDRVPANGEDICGCLSASPKRHWARFERTPY